MQKVKSVIKDEMVMHVDQWNRDLGAIKRIKIVQDRLWLRSGYCYIIVTGKDRKERFLVQERSLLKNYCPGCFDLASGGLFDPGESKRANAIREV